eukprot:CAMPEP_0172944576 /NCGR_PEP_ID=MMETSP1075-20121228/226117_1 /TAXON_ID=2916 /ORGANISM="Ceratium fusus, Strain PA161109" /LENGTH=271 /DNA_ID=CAMNT_0013806003 /DNA_START=558 /DNA_END=1373 /DNA_ORIENTATION=+
MAAAAAADPVVAEATEAAPHPDRAALDAGRPAGLAEAGRWRVCEAVSGEEFRGLGLGAPTSEDPVLARLALGALLLSSLFLTSVLWQAQPCEQAQRPAWWKVWQLHPATSHAWKGRGTMVSAGVATGTQGARRNVKELGAETSRMAAPQRGAASYAAMFRERVATKAERAWLCPSAWSAARRRTTTWRAPKIPHLKAPQTQNTKWLGAAGSAVEAARAAAAGGGGAAQGRCDSQFEVPPLRPTRARRQSLALVIVWKRSFASSAAPGFLSG